MPALLTHYEFFKIVEPKASMIGLIGAQGPDPFFFYGYGILKSQKDKDLRNYGTLLHSVDPYITFKYLLEYIMGSLDNEKPVLIEFTKGLLAHYLLDRNCHPYVWYKSGFVTEQDNDPVKYFYSHTSIESAIDVLVMNHFKDNTTTFDSLKYDKKAMKIVTKMMFSLGKVCYQNKNIKIHSFKKAVDQMHFVQRALYSKTGKKKAWFDKHLRNTPLSSMSEDRIENLKLDYLNLNHKIWRNCVTNLNPRKDDFFKLLDDAKKEYKEFSKLFDDVLNGKTKITNIDKYFGKIDHNGFKVNSIKVYSDYIFK